VLSGRGLCDGLITRPEESNWMWCVVLYDLQTSCMRRPWSTVGCRARNQQTKNEKLHFKCSLISTYFDSFSTWWIFNEIKERTLYNFAIIRACKVT